MKKRMSFLRVFLMTCMLSANIFCPVSAAESEQVGEVLLMSSSGENQKTVYSYDEYGRLCESISMNEAEDGTWIAEQFDCREYDENGNLTTRRIHYCTENGDFSEGAMETWYNNYSEDGFLSSYIYYPRNGSDADYIDYTLDYDEEGRLYEEYGEMMDGSNTYDIYSYDDGSNLPSSKYHSSSSVAASTTTTEYTYDESGNCIEEILFVQYQQDWEYFERTVRTFDENGNLLDESFYENDGDFVLKSDTSIDYLNLQWSSEGMNVYTYDEENHLVQSAENCFSKTKDTVRTNYVYGKIEESMQEIPVEYNGFSFIYDKTMISEAGNYGEE